MGVTPIKGKGRQKSVQEGIKYPPGSEWAPRITTPLKVCPGKHRPWNVRLKWGTSTNQAVLIPPTLRNPRITDRRPCSQGPFPGLLLKPFLNPPFRIPLFLGKTVPPIKENPSPLGFSQKNMELKAHQYSTPKIKEIKEEKWLT